MIGDVVDNFFKSKPFLLPDNISDHRQIAALGHHSRAIFAFHHFIGGKTFGKSITNSVSRKIIVRRPLAEVETEVAQRSLKPVAELANFSRKLILISCGVVPVEATAYENCDGCFGIAGSVETKQNLEKQRVADVGPTIGGIGAVFSEKVCRWTKSLGSHNNAAHLFTHVLPDKFVQPLAVYRTCHEHFLAIFVQPRVKE